MKQPSGGRTLLASVLLSAPGPLVVGLGLFWGRSATQLADFIRRSAELAAILVSWGVYRATRRGEPADPDRRARLEAAANLWVAAALCLSGAAMLAAALLPPGGQKGNVVPGLVIALLGVVTNTWFWLRYRKLNRLDPGPILGAQARLYRAKALVDACVTVALGTVAAAPASPAALVMDRAGSVAVAVYLLLQGALAAWGQKGKGRREKRNTGNFSGE